MLFRTTLFFGMPVSASRMRELPMTASGVPPTLTWPFTLLTFVSRKLVASDRSSRPVSNSKRLRPTTSMPLVRESQAFR